MNLILLGPPGAGKGTQAANMSRKLGIAHVATGDMFRQAISQGTDVGLRAKGYLDKGKLVPDDVTTQMVLERIQKPDCKRGFILDGYPRNLNQAQSLDRALRDKNSTIDSVILIEVSDKELLRRLSGRWICRSCQTPFNVVSSPPKVNGKCDRCGGELYQRNDDTEAVIKDRLKVYTEQSLPLIEYYSKVGKLKKIDGEQSIEAVERDLLSTASAKAGRN